MTVVALFILDFVRTRFDVLYPEIFTNTIFGKKKN